LNGFAMLWMWWPLVIFGIASAIRLLSVKFLGARLDDLDQATPPQGSCCAIETRPAGNGWLRATGFGKEAAERPNRPGKSYSGSRGTPGPRDSPRPASFIPQRMQLHPLGLPRQRPEYIRPGQATTAKLTVRRHPAPPDPSPPPPNSWLFTKPGKSPSPHRSRPTIPIATRTITSASPSQITHRPGMPRAPFGSRISRVRRATV